MILGMRAFSRISVWSLIPLLAVSVGGTAAADEETQLILHANQSILVLPDFKDYYVIKNGKVLNGPTGKCSSQVKLKATNVREQIVTLEMEQGIAMMWVDHGVTAGGLLFDQIMRQMEQAKKPLGKTIKISIANRGSDGVGRALQPRLLKLARQRGFENIECEVYYKTPNVTGAAGWRPMKSLTFSVDENSISGTKKEEGKDTPKAKPKSKAKL